MKLPRIWGLRRRGDGWDGGGLGGAGGSKTPRSRLRRPSKQALCALVCKHTCFSSFIVCLLLCAWTCWKRTMRPIFFSLASAARLRGISASYVPTPRWWCRWRAASRTDMMRNFSPGVRGTMRLAARVSAWCAADNSPELFVALGVLDTANC